MQYNSTPMPSIPNILKKINGQPTIPMYPGDIPSYSPPSRSFFTPPLPPEYQNPFADKPTLRGTNNEGLISNTVPFNNRRPIPPPSLMPGHERIPFRPPDLAASIGNGDGNSNHNSNDSYFASSAVPKKPLVATSMEGALDIAGDRKKALNTPARNGNDAGAVESSDPAKNRQTQDVGASNSKENSNKRQEVLPNIRRILGSNGKKGDIPAVLLRHVTQRPMVPYHQPPASPIVSVDNVETANGNGKNSSITDVNGTSSAASPNINKSKQSPGQFDYNNSSVARDSFESNPSQTTVTTSSATAAIGEAAATFTSASATANAKPTLKSISAAGKSDQDAGVTGIPTKEGNTVGAAAAAASAHTTWTWAWNIHIYLSVVLFTILAVYSLYKLVTYNKLTHLFAQSYFVYIQLILITICILRIIYLCVDAYNIHGTFPIFAAELLLNLPSTFLTVAFAVLILFLFLKSLNHKNNRYSALVRPLTVVVGCGVHVGLCITLHYVESYTLQNHHLYYQQQQQHQYFRRQQQQQQHQQQHQQLLQHSQSPFSGSPSTSLANSPPHRVLSLICQIIYIFICFTLGLLYLYLYRILKRILRSKSQNYIHGYQNLSYAIHITIATALLFVLLAALQIFGAICISAARPLLSQANIVEIDWMQWGYQFSLRLIEIAIITLISWVTGLKTSVGSNVNATISLNSDVRMAGQASGGFGTNATGSVIREKHAVAAPSHNTHSNVANFFLPCTSSSSQEQFETDYPAICNANTNLHTYTMRTGKLIYDDSYALNSLAGPSVASPSGGGTEYQLQEPMYQRPYDTGSIRSAINHNITTEYGPQSSRYHHIHHNMRAHEPASYMSADYMTDATTDHYENPNFDLRTNSTGAVGVVGVAVMQNQAKNTVSSGSASGSGSGSGSSGTSGTSQQQMLLLQSDSCYSEPLQENSSYEFNNFERPVFQEKSIDSIPHSTDECWPEREKEGRKITKNRDKKHNSKLEATTENPERRSSNSTNSCSSSNGIRYTSYNSYESGGHYNGVRKSGTLNSIDNCSAMLACQNGGISIASGPGPGPGPGRAIAVKPSIKRLNGAQTLTHSERSHYFQRNGRNISTINNRTLPLNEFELAPSVCNEFPLKQHQMKQQQKPYHHSQQHYNSEEDEDDEDIISGSNVECTNLISNSELGYCIASDNSITSKTPHLHVQNNTKISSIHQRIAHKSLQEHSVTCSPELKSNTLTASGDMESQSCISDSVIVADQGFLHFRGSNEEQVELGHGKAMNEVPSRSVSLICTSVNGINC
ncbi:uncharacterized protein LOC108655392 [Drosophila navojoa]|uniref:uncharacterized protein LOC108655392 n=1 Tax=Drosophila navojoa TaxID=7232 RepID=UPI000847B82D|nr:uncharacterized protein LOC108655392 [Drosophila navojoa]